MLGLRQPESGRETGRGRKRRREGRAREQHLLDSVQSWDSK